MGVYYQCPVTSMGQVRKHVQNFTCSVCILIGSQSSIIHYTNRSMIYLCCLSQYQFTLISVPDSIVSLLYFFPIPTDLIDKYSGTSFLNFLSFSCLVATTSILLSQICYMLLPFIFLFLFMILVVFLCMLFDHLFVAVFLFLFFLLLWVSKICGWYNYFFF